MRGKGTKLGEGCPKVRLSQDRMPILGEGERDQEGFSGLLCQFMVRFGIVSFGKSSWCQNVLITNFIRMYS